MKPALRQRDSVFFAEGQVAAARQSAARCAFGAWALCLPLLAAAAPAPNIVTPPSVQTLPDTPTAQDLFRVRVFEEPLVPIGGEPTPAENAALATALKGYASLLAAPEVAPCLVRH
jgi:hypothetical protein